MYIYWRPAQERSGLFLARYLDRVFSGPREGLSTNYSLSVTYLGHGLICFPFYYFMTEMISTFFFLVKTLQIVQIMANIVSWIILICSPGDTELHLIFIRVHFLFFFLKITMTSIHVWGEVHHIEVTVFLVSFQFIGFLEPYMLDGHSKGWKH